MLSSVIRNRPLSLFLVEFFKDKITCPWLSDTVHLELTVPKWNRQKMGSHLWKKGHHLIVKFACLCLESSRRQTGKTALWKGWVCAKLGLVLLNPVHIHWSLLDHFFLLSLVDVGQSPCWWTFYFYHWSAIFSLLLPPSGKLLPNSGCQLRKQRLSNGQQQGMYDTALRNFISV